MAERADLTPAEILARQRMLEEALAGQDADAELFGRLGPQKPVANNRDYEYGPIVPVPEDQQEYIFDPVLRDQLDRGKAFQGVPLSVSQDRRMAENPIGTMATGIGSLLDRDRREVLMPAAQEFGPSRQEFNPANNQFENRTTETIRPGVYRNPETMPGMSGTPIYQGLDAASSLISDTAARRRGLKDSAQARSQAAEIIPQIPQMLVDQADVSMEAGLRGERVVNEQNMSGTPFDVFAAPIGALGAGRVAMDIPEGRSFGIFASGKGASGQQAEDTVSMLEDAGLSPAEGWERQSGANTFKAYRSSLDNKVRYEIPMQNAKFASIVKKTEDPDVELGKALDPETRTEERLLDMQKLRVTTNQFDDKEYLGVPASFDMNEKELNKYGFTTNAGVAAQGKYQLFPKPVLEQIMDFPELFDEYPQLRNLKIGPVGMFSFGVAGSYSPDEKMIRLGSVKNTGDGRREMMSTLLHEIQHAIQDIEGQYGGASPSMFTPDGFDEIRLTNIKARKVVDDNIEKGLSEIPVNVGGIRDTLTKVFKLKQSDSLASSKNNRLDGIVTDKDWSSLRRRVARYANQRAEEANDRAAGKIDASQMGRDKAKKNLEEELIMRVRIMGRPLTPEEETKARTKSASYAFNYSGSDRDLIYINDALNKAGVKSPEEVTKKISESFDERVKELQPLLVEDKELSNISRQAYTQYSGNPGEVEARNTELRFKGVLGRDNFKSGVTQYRDADGELVRAEKTITPEELQRTFPEETQQMVLPEEGLIYSLSEGRKNNPSMSIDNSGINNDLDKKRAKLQQQQGIYANRNGQLLGDGSSSKPLAATTRKKLEEERRVAGRKAMELSHEIDIEEAEPNLPDNIITRDSSGSILPSTDYHQANQLAFHGTRGADSRIMEEGGVHMKTDEPAFFMVDSPAASMTYGAGGIGDLGTVVPMRIDTRGFAEIDYRGRSYGELDEGGTVGVEFPQETTFLGQKGTAFEVEIDFDDIVTVRVDGSAAKTVPVDLIEQYHPEGRGVVNEETFLNAVKDAGAPGARLSEINDLHPTGAMVLRGSTQLKLPETQEILTVFDKSRQRLAKGNPASPDDDLMTGIVRNPLSGFGQGGPVQNFNQGGMVSPMNKPRITQGLTNLLNKYSTGPLAGAGNVSRGTPVQGFGMGGQVYSDGRYYSDDRVMRPGELSDPTGAYQGQDVPYDPQLDPYGFTYNTEFGYGGGGGEGGAGNTNFSDEYLNSFDLSAYNNTSADAVTPTPPVPLATTNTSTNTSTNTGPFTPAYTEPAVVETPINFEDNPVLSVPVVAPAATTPVEPVPVAPTPVAATPVAPTPVAAAPVVASQPIPNPITYPTAPVEAAVAPPNYFVPEEERVETFLPPSVYNPPAPPTESVYTPPAATVVDTPATLFTPPPVVAVPEAKPYNYLQELRPNFDISDVIKTQTGGYAPTQGMVINPTQYQYSPDQVMADNVYVPEIYQSLPQLDLSTVDVEDLADTDAAEVGFDANTTIDYNDLNYGSGGFAPQRDDYLPGGSFHMPGTEITGQQQYNVAYQQYEADFARRNGYTLEELRQINDYRTNNGLPRLQDMDINTESGMS